MTLKIMVGRKTAKNWFRRQAHAVSGMISFQQNIWLMVKQSFSQAKKVANKQNPQLLFHIEDINENIDLTTKFEWIKIIIQGTREEEQSEYDDMQNFYKPLGKLLKKNVSDMETTEKPNFFKSSILNAASVDDAYKKGYGSVSDKNIANKILEMGILLSIEKIDDYSDPNRGNII